MQHPWVLVLFMGLTGCETIAGIVPDEEVSFDDVPFFEKSGTVSVEDLVKTFKSGCLDAFPDFSRHKKAFQNLGFRPDGEFAEQNWLNESDFRPSYRNEWAVQKRSGTSANYGNTDSTVHVSSMTFCHVQAHVKDPDLISVESVLALLPPGGKRFSDSKEEILLRYMEDGQEVHIYAKLPGVMHVTSNEPIEWCDSLLKCRSREEMEFEISMPTVFSE